VQPRGHGENTGLIPISQCRRQNCYMIMTIPGDNDMERMIVSETETEHSQQTFQMSTGEGSSAVMVFKLMWRE